MNIPLPERAVLVADDLLPSELTALDGARLVAICLSGGGATSHVAILAAAMEIPMLVGLGAGIRDIASGATVIVDGDAGTLLIAPTAAAVEQARAAVESRLMRRAKTQAEAQTECRALDGTRVEVFANLGNAMDAAAAVANGAEGCGLLRTEFLFIDRETAPAESEQLAAYQGIATALGIPPERLYAAAGWFEPESSDEHEVETAIRTDPRLTDGQKEALIAVYRGFLDQEREK